MTRGHQRKGQRRATIRSVPKRATALIAALALEQ